MSAISQPTWLVDTQTSCFVFFNHGGAIQTHNHNLGPFVSPSGFWQIGALMVSEMNQGLPVGGDSVNVMLGTKAQHTVQPPGPAHAADAAVGTEADIGGPALNAAAYPQGGSITRSLSVNHPAAHSDLFSVVLTAAVNGANITNYRISISGEHTDPLPVVGKGRRDEVRVTEHKY